MTSFAEITSLFLIFYTSESNDLYLIFRKCFLGHKTLMLFILVADFSGVTSLFIYTVLFAVIPLLKKLKIERHELNRFACTLSLAR